MPLPPGVKLAVGGRAGIRNEASVPLIKPLGIRNKVSIRSQDVFVTQLVYRRNQICRQVFVVVFISPGFRAGFLDCRPSVVLLHTYHSFVPELCLFPKEENKQKKVRKMNTNTILACSQPCKTSLPQTLCTPFEWLGWTWWPAHEVGQAA